MSAKALDNIRVLDLSRVLAGPYCTQMLGDLGADILKIEKPGAGDDTRKWGPPFMKDANGNDTTESAYYLSCNRNKKSISVDITHEDGQAIIHQLLQNTDILIQNFKVGGLEKYGLSHEQLKDKYPRLIYCSISGFGQDGPLAQEPGYDFMAQGIAGLMACTGEAGGQPMKVGVALSDVMTGMNAAIGILAALNARTQTGAGQHIDVALTDTTLASLVNIAQYYLTSGTPAPRLGNAHSAIVPYNVFKTKDGHIIVAVGNDVQFSRLCENLGHADWASDERFSTNRTRVEHRDIITSMIQNTLNDKTTSKWIDIFRTANVPCSPVNTMDQAFDMEQIQSRGMQIHMDHPLSDAPIDLVGSPIKLSGTPVSYDLAPPTAGQHTKEILKNTLGMDIDTIKQLQRDKIIG